MERWGTARALAEADVRSWIPHWKGGSHLALLPNACSDSAPPVSSTQALHSLLDTAVKQWRDNYGTAINYGPGWRGAV